MQHRAELVMVHGAGGGGWEWLSWRRLAVARGWPVRAPDLQPGPQGLAATGFHDYLGQVAAWRPEGRDVLVGASLGGLLALAAAAARPPRALVLVCPLPPAPWSARLPDPAPVDAVRRWSRSADLAATRAAIPDADPATALLAARRWRDESGRALRQARDLHPAGPDCPVLVIAASGDREVPPALLASWAHEVGFDLLGVPGSHVGPLLGSGADAVARLALDWIEATFSTV